MVEPDIEYRPLQRFFMDNIPPDLALYNEYHALIVALGNNYCANKTAVQQMSTRATVQFSV